MTSPVATSPTQMRAFSPVLSVVKTESVQTRRLESGDQSVHSPRVAIGRWPVPSALMTHSCGSRPEPMVRGPKAIIERSGDQSGWAAPSDANSPCPPTWRALPSGSITNSCSRSPTNRTNASPAAAVASTGVGSAVGVCVGSAVTLAATLGCGLGSPEAGALVPAWHAASHIESRIAPAGPGVRRLRSVA